ncbi:7645_t:CDS:2, partial [Racocetra persica]
SGHKGWKCNYCHEENLRASDINMHAHLGLICQSAPLNIKQDCLRNFPAPKKKKIIHEIASGVQPRIDSKFQNISIMDPGQEQLCNKALIRFLVCCGIPFWIVESPFFLDFCQNLCVPYKPPDRKTLSNDWLNYETARITIAIEKELENENNLTLDYSINSHTAIFTADEIEKVLIDIGIDKFGAV